jgi:tight adherence protein B
MPVALAEARLGVGAGLGAELDAVLTDTAGGTSFSAALEAWSARNPSRDVQLLVVALVVGLEVGGQRARVLEEVAESIRDRMALRRDADRQATQARLSAWVVALAPVGFAAAAFASNPEALRFLVATPLGWVCLVAGLGLDGLGAWWMRALGRRATWLS